MIPYPGITNKWFSLSVIQHNSSHSLLNILSEGLMAKKSNQKI